MLQPTTLPPAPDVLNRKLNNNNNNNNNNNSNNSKKYDSKCRKHQQFGDTAQHLSRRVPARLRCDVCKQANSGNGKK
jgi:hypothetical protein